jgi:hypothetical protein
MKQVKNGVLPAKEGIHTAEEYTRKSVVNSSSTINRNKVRDTNSLRNASNRKY